MIVIIVNIGFIKGIGSFYISLVFIQAFKPLLLVIPLPIKLSSSDLSFEKKTNEVLNNNRIK
jgi:hypothetical protein